MFNKKEKKEMPAKPKKPVKQKEKKGMGLFGKKKKKLEPMLERTVEEMPVLQPQYDGISNPIPESNEPNASNIWGTNPVFDFGSSEAPVESDGGVMPEWGDVSPMQSFGNSTEDWVPTQDVYNEQCYAEPSGMGMDPIFGAGDVDRSPNEYLMENDFVDEDITEDGDVPEFNLNEFMTPPQNFTDEQMPPVNDYFEKPVQEPVFNMGDCTVPPIFDEDSDIPSDVVGFSTDEQDSYIPEPAIELAKDTSFESFDECVPGAPVEPVELEKSADVPVEPVVIERPADVPVEPVESAVKVDPLLKYYMDCPFDSERGSYIIETKEEEFLFDGAKDLLDIQRRAMEAEEKIKYDEYMKENKFVFIDGDLSSVAHEIDKVSNEDAFVFNGSTM